MCGNCPKSTLKAAMDGAPEPAMTPEPVATLALPQTTPVAPAQVATVPDIVLVVAGVLIGMLLR